MALTAKGFVACASSPHLILQTIRGAIDILRTHATNFRLQLWDQSDIAGSFVAATIRSDITSADLVVADVSIFNFNVTYEIGYAIGSRKPVFLIRNPAIATDSTEVREVGIFDTLGYREYQNSQQLADLLLSIKEIRALQFDDSRLNHTAPVFLLDMQYKTNSIIRIVSRIKKAGLRYRSFDPLELPRLSAGSAIDSVASSLGVVIPLVAWSIHDARIHNIRAAFLAGLAHGMDKPTLLLQEGTEPVPLDYRDLVSSFTHPNQIDISIAELASEVTTALQDKLHKPATEIRTPLARIDLGALAAENEFGDLGRYYLRTDQFERSLRGEAQVIVGRKGAGKTALFAQLRDSVRENRAAIVLDLKPESYQLLEFKEQILVLLSLGTQEHTITAFWEYVLLLEVCFKILEKDWRLHRRDHRLYQPYLRLKELYYQPEYSSDGDFAERLYRLIQGIGSDFRVGYNDASQLMLGQSELTRIIYRHDIPELKRNIVEYMKYKDGIWILFDNLDKGWSARGLQSDDLRIVRCLIDATRKLEREFMRSDISCKTLIFIRNDVYELLVSTTPDRGKDVRLSLDWTDPDLLREFLRKRFIDNEGVDSKAAFMTIWREVCTPLYRGEETSQYFIERSLMRPRYLLSLFYHCKSVAVNLDHTRIVEDDIQKGESAYSTDLLTEVGYELRDVFPKAEDVLYEFLGMDPNVSEVEIRKIGAERGLQVDECSRLMELLLWFGFLGLTRSSGEVSYIHTVNYDVKRLQSIVRKTPDDQRSYHINPAFWEGLEIRYK